MTDVWVYSLSDPDTGRVRYIGASSRPKFRYHQHLAAVDQPGIKGDWLRELASRGLQPALRLLEQAPSTTAWERETVWINVYHQLGHDLLNMRAPSPSVARLYGSRARLSNPEPPASGPRNGRQVRVDRACVVCGRSFQTVTAATCSKRCRQRRYRQPAPTRAIPTISIDNPAQPCYSSLG